MQIERQEILTSDMQDNYTTVYIKWLFGVETGVVLGTLVLVALLRM